MGDDVWLEEGDGKDGEEDEEVDEEEGRRVDGDAVCTGHILRHEQQQVPQAYDTPAPVLDRKSVV